MSQSSLSQSQLTSSSAATSAAKEEVRKLSLQLQSQQKKVEESVDRLRQQHTQTVQKLEDRVSYTTHCLSLYYDEHHSLYNSNR